MNLCRLMISLSIFWLSTEASAEGSKNKIRIHAGGIYQEMAVSLDNINSRFKGSAQDYQLEFLMPDTQLSLGFLLGTNIGDVTNTANTDDRKETLSGATYSLALRAYSSFMFLGFKLSAGEKNLEIKLPTNFTTDSYLFYAFACELGTEFHLTSMLDLIPSIQYQKSYLEPKSSADPTASSNDLSGTLSLAVKF